MLQASGNTQLRLIVNSNYNASHPTNLPSNENSMLKITGKPLTCAYCRWTKRTNGLIQILPK